MADSQSASKQRGSTSTRIVQVPSSSKLPRTGKSGIGWAAKVREKLKRKRTREAEGRRMEEGWGRGTNGVREVFLQFCEIVLSDREFPLCYLSKQRRTAAFVICQNTISIP